MTQSHSNESEMSQPDPPDDGTRVSPPRPAPPTDTGAGTGAWTTGGAKGASSDTPSRIGRFEIRSVLGQGAFGCVYLAFDPELQRQVAIKVPHRESLTPAFRDRFLLEARATATIHHPNVCPVYEVGTDGDLPFIVMHYVVGGTLAGLLNRLEQPLSPRHALTIARKLALGMAAAHAQGVIHRDLKPQNILYDKTSREVLITDFGLARTNSDSSRRTADGAVLGTPAYMSPEQARGNINAIGPLSDVYSLGLVLYHLLTGEVPFTGTIFEVLAQHWESPPRPPSSIRSDLDPRLNELCLKALAKNPADRYPSAKAFADALAEHLREKTSTDRDQAITESVEGRTSKGKPAQPSTKTLELTSMTVAERHTKPPSRSTSRGLFLLAAVVVVLFGAVAIQTYFKQSSKTQPVVLDPPRMPELPSPPPKEDKQPLPEDKLKAEMIGKWRFVGLPPWVTPGEAKKMGLIGNSFFLEFEPDGVAHYGADTKNKLTKSVSFKYQVMSEKTVEFQDADGTVFPHDKKTKTSGRRIVVITDDEMTITAENGRTTKLVRVR